ncbi:MAG: ROK family protein [Chloroflexi bacterium]|nr:ROK family protein [Chloroflexota bacterium]
MTRKHHDVLVGAIEAGGTKFVCAVGTGPQDLQRTEFPTADDPARVLSQVTDWLGEQQCRRGTLQGIGIAAFGPLDLHKGSPTYGYITSSPKLAWRNTDIVGAVRRVFPNIPVGFDTDVNAATLGEHRWGNGAGLEDFVYVTIGTGIGGGAIVGGQLLHGLVHPEMGHTLIPRVPGDTFVGVCPYHGACWEGLCSGPALLKRSGMLAEQLPPEHEAWALATQYIAYAVANLVCFLSPQRVIIGGSVRKAGLLGEEHFFQMIREKVQVALNGYIVSPALNEEIGAFIVPPLLGDDAGVCGAIALGQAAIA